MSTVLRGGLFSLEVLPLGGLNGICLIALKYAGSDWISESKNYLGQVQVISSPIFQLLVVIAISPY